MQRTEKRQRMMASANDGDIICIPDLLFMSIGQYMSYPSRALFAAALCTSTTPSTSSRHDNLTENPSASAAILHYYHLLGGDSNLVTLDCSVDVEKKLAAKS